MFFNPRCTISELFALVIIQLFFIFQQNPLKLLSIQIMISLLLQSVGNWTSNDRNFDCVHFKFTRLCFYTPLFSSKSKIDPHKCHKLIFLFSLNLKKPVGIKINIKYGRKIVFFSRTFWICVMLSGTIVICCVTFSPSKHWQRAEFLHFCANAKIKTWLQLGGSHVVMVGIVVKVAGVQLWKCFGCDKTYSSFVVLIF